MASPRRGRANMRGRKNNSANNSNNSTNSSTSRSNIENNAVISNHSSSSNRRPRRSGGYKTTGETEDDYNHVRNNENSSVMSGLTNDDLKQKVKENDQTIKRLREEIRRAQRTSAKKRRTLFAIDQVQQKMQRKRDEYEVLKIEYKRLRDEFEQATITSSVQKGQADATAQDVPDKSISMASSGSSSTAHGKYEDDILLGMIIVWSNNDQI